MEITEIQKLIDALHQSSIDELEYQTEDVKLRLKRNRKKNTQYVETEKKKVESFPVENLVTEVACTNQVEELKPVEETYVKEDLYEITSPMVGTFYSSPSPGADPYVKVGQKIDKETIVCVVEAMKLFNEIESEVQGEIVEILVGNGELVEYDQPMFLVRKK
ncbi:acetyl-CoA carboxylase biotin carboxyl carrier protein [Bacillus bingmayongensis]|uniref:acetyl-CoA carboxylase biotin carboxyl carrier protein n=1 Tax=Bacillus bingmayongensis TaxID=1150157 RepID=UPI0003037DB7|nr:acetyl-CoA carboxylase biotin carboxyl carrier protein [Bacillus bingmayongensis]MBY0595868.1 acetyl-CoA carboxylase biotin carboxyl carrier protein [Bacillus bingmayongensis]